MNDLLWIVVIACFILSFVALIRPIIPGVPILWIGILVYHFGVNRGELTFLFWFILVVLTLFIFLVDIFANKYFLGKSGSSKWSEKISVVAIVVGSFIVPFGLVIVPFVSVFVVERLHKKSIKQSAKIAWSTVLSFLASSLAKVLLQVMIISIFFAFVIL